MNVRKLATALLYSFLIAIPAQATAADFFSDLSGQWSGSGQAYLKRLGDVSALCRLSVASRPSAAKMNGSCRFLLFRQTLGLTLNKGGGQRVIGTYTGARTGPANVAGTVNGNNLTLAVTWAAPVNGDRKAQMFLRRTGKNSFEQTVIDQVDGQTKRTAHFSFQRK
jgi:hypothetical protein